MGLKGVLGLDICLAYSPNDLVKQFIVDAVQKRAKTGIKLWI